MRTGLVDCRSGTGAQHNLSQSPVGDRLLPLSQPDLWATAVLVDEFDAG
jgi:hypothetical protein